MSDYLLDVAVFIDPLGGGFIADPWNPGQIVRGFALERDKIYPLLRRDAVTLQDGGTVVTDDIGDSPPGHDHRNTIAHELEDVAIAGYNHDLMSVRAAVFCQGGEQIIGFIAFQLDHRNAQRFENLADQRKLLAKCVGSFGSPCLVLSIAVKAELGRAFVETYHDGLRALVG